MSAYDKRANICFDCKNSVPDTKGHGCPWSRNFEPVPGWTAELTVLRPGVKYEEMETYRITACPLFDGDGRSTTNSIKVRCQETGVVYDSITAAAKAVGGYSSDISQALKTRQRFACGYHWERED